MNMLLFEYIDLCHRVGSGWSRQSRRSKTFCGEPVSSPGLNRRVQRCLHPRDYISHHDSLARKKEGRSKKKSGFQGKGRAGPHIPKLIEHHGSARLDKGYIGAQSLRR